MSTSSPFRRRLPRLLVAASACLVLGTSVAQAQGRPSDRPGPLRRFSWAKFGAGVAVSLASHELAHVATALAVGGHPYLTFDSGRPVIESGVNPRLHPSRSFAFSAAGMVSQLALSELILDLPHGAGPAKEFEKGFLAAGVGTVAFYLTVGRDAQVGDIAQMQMHSSLSKWTLTAIFGGLAATDLVRMAVNPRYANFFAVPMPTGRLAVGMGTAF